jgi:hypothetical protein
MAAKKRKAAVKKRSSQIKPSITLQFAIVFVIIAVIALVAFAYKNYF